MAKTKNTTTSTNATTNTTENLPQSPITDIEQNKPNEFFIPRNYARSQVQPLWANTSTSSASIYTLEQINNLLKNPYSSYKQLQGVADYLYNTNSNYNNILDYLSIILAFKYIIYPFGITENKTTVKNRIYNSAKIISKMQIEQIFPIMIKRAMHCGETYWYDLSDSENTIIVEIPKEICVLSHIDDDNLWRYYVDLSLITKISLPELPQEIQDAYNKHIANGKPKGKKKIAENIFIPEHYYEVSKKGFAIFAHMQKKAHDYPLLLHMFGDLTLLSNDKSYFNEFIKDDAVKTIHQKVPVDKETGVPLMDKDTIEAYHNSSKEHVGKNISIMTNPFEVEGIALDKNQQSAINVVEHDIKVIQNDSGISETIFNANTTNGLGYSTKADSAKIFPILYFFTNLINYKIKPYKCQIKFLNINIFEEKEKHEDARTDLLSGGSRSLFMATSPLDLYSYLNLIEMEQLLEFDELLPPKLNASQGSAEDLNKKNGNPGKKEEDKEDSTIVVDGYK